MNHNLIFAGRVMVVAAAFLSVTLQASAQNSIQWVHSLSEAQAKAKAENRVVLVHFWSTTCPPCRKLEANVFPDPQFAQSVNAGFVPVKVNINDEKDIARRYRIRRIPTDLFLTPEGAEVFRTISPQDPVQYAGLLGKIQGHVASLKRPQIDAIAALDAQRRSTVPQINANRPNVQQPNVQQPNVQRPGVQQPGVQQPGVVSRSGNTLSTDRGASRYGETKVEDVSIAQAAPENNRYAKDSRQNNPHVADARPAYGADVTMAHQAPGPEESIPVAHRPNVGTSQQPQGPAATMQFALMGHCPVTLVENTEWKAGDRRWGAEHDKQVYLFSNQQCQQMFLANPRKYVPAFRGFDAVHFHHTGQFVAGKIDFGIVYGDEYFLFESEESLNRFWQESETFVNTVRQAMSRAQPRR
jgi:thiol-disulfide isomerase/thioredoxin/YHS domain-containing protein